MRTMVIMIFAGQRGQVFHYYFLILENNLGTSPIYSLPNSKFSKVNLKNGIIGLMTVRKDETADMKPRPNHDVYIKVLRRMSAEQHLLKAFELSALTRELFIAGMRRRFPDLNAIEFKKLIRERLEKCHNQIY